MCENLGERIQHPLGIYPEAVEQGHMIGLFLRF